MSRTRTLSFEIPEPLKNGQCNKTCPFFIKADNSIGNDGVHNDSCDLHFGSLATVRLEHPVAELYDERLFPAGGCPWK